MSIGRIRDRELRLAAHSCSDSSSSKCFLPLTAALADLRTRVAVDTVWTFAHGYTYFDGCKSRFRNKPFFPSPVRLAGDAPTPP
jgi:hypothetical protein